MKALITGAGGFVAPYLRKAVSDDLNCEITFTGRACGKHDKGKYMSNGRIQRIRNVQNHTGKNKPQ